VRQRIVRYATSRYLLTATRSHHLEGRFQLTP
jgi:hypothetical protein